MDSRILAPHPSVANVPQLGLMGLIPAFDSISSLGTTRSSSMKAVSEVGDGVSTIRTLRDTPLKMDLLLCIERSK